MSDHELGARIKRRRKALKLTQEQLGGLVGGLSTKTICTIEKGSRALTARECWAFAKALQWSLDHLLAEEEVEPLDPSMSFGIGVRPRLA